MYCMATDVKRRLMIRKMVASKSWYATTMYMYAYYLAL